MKQAIRGDSGTWHTAMKVLSSAPGQHSTAELHRIVISVAKGCPGDEAVQVSCAAAQSSTLSACCWQLQLYSSKRAALHPILHGKGGRNVLQAPHEACSID